MTEIAVTSTGYQVEKRSWLLSPHGVEAGSNRGITVDAALFTAATHFPNGYLPSGTALSAAGGPYSGTGACVGLLFSSLKFATPASKVGGALVNHGYVNTLKLPFPSGTGSLGAGGVAALPLITFTAGE